MNKTATPNDALKACVTRLRGDIASLADWFDCELTKQDDDINWATVGTLGQVRENLIETLAFFSNISRDDIEKTLDELHEE